MKASGMLLSPVKVVATSADADEYLAMIQNSLDDHLPFTAEEDPDDFEPVTYTVVVDGSVAIRFSRLAFGRDLTVRVVSNQHGSYPGTLALRVVEVMEAGDL